jgi:peptidoglycan-N-acetylglucosamine deacetylase
MNALSEPVPMLNGPAARAWHPTPLIRASVALHVGAAGLAIARPGLWPWALSAVVADHLLLTAAGLWPRSRLLGPNYTRLPDTAGAAVAITIDDGPDPQVTPRVLTLLEQHGAQATFFCIGERVAQYPRLAAEIVQRGHTIENHSHRHRHHFSLLGPRALSDEIERAQEAIAAATGERAWFFRAPAGLRNPFLEPVLARAGLRLVSWSRRGFDTVNGSAARVLNTLTRGLAAGDILLLHDGHAARTDRGSAVVLEVLPRLLTRLEDARLRAVTLRAAFSQPQSSSAAAAS